ncbi:hypothetical protein YC2023_080726 [Brassica napus]
MDNFNVSRRTDNFRSIKKVKIQKYYSVDACLNHFGECLTETASTYSFDGLVDLNCQEALGMVNFDVSCPIMFINFIVHYCWQGWS